MNITIVLLCFNERAILPHMVKHYRKYLPSCKIIIYDNESTDGSVEIALFLGCTVISWNSNNIIDDKKYIDIKNNCWKHIKDGWIIMADMDEFLCITEEELMDETNRGTTILSIKGIDMIGESQTLDLSDIDLQSITKYVENDWLSKKLCFLRNSIEEINYDVGCHTCKPIGKIQYSEKLYLNKHMCNLGLNFLIDRIIKRYERSEKMRSEGWCVHYINDVEKIKNNYNDKLLHCKMLDI
jgi:glycosyltransferase involved in cell wall biosynthesis